jgi:hypothetical protein
MALFLPSGYQPRRQLSVTTVFFLLPASGASLTIQHDTPSHFIDIPTLKAYESII